MGKALTNNEFVRRAREVYKNKYSYSKTNYVNSDTKIIITCLEHGDFEKRPLKFLAGRECYECKKNNKIALLIIKYNDDFSDKLTYLL